MRILLSFNAAHHDGKDIDLHDLFSFYRRFWTPRPKVQPGHSQPQPAQPIPAPECEEGFHEEGGEEEPLEDDGYVEIDDALDGCEDPELGEKLGLLVSHPVTKPPKSAMDIARAERLARIQQLKTLDIISRTLPRGVSYLGPIGSRDLSPRKVSCSSTKPTINPKP